MAEMPSDRRRRKDHRAKLRTAQIIRFIYLALVVSAAALAILRLSESAEMPGLQAIELVLLALPWSFALGIEPLSRLGFTGMATIVVIGLGLNTLLLHWLARLFALHHRPRV
jgi:hypothetical protein